MPTLQNLPFALRSPLAFRSLRRQYPAMTLTAIVLVLIPFLLGYLSGSIPFGLILTKLFGAGDLRAIGSGNIGATNVLRTGHKGLAATTLLLDLAKGALPVLLITPVLARYLPVGPVSPGLSDADIVRVFIQPLYVAGLGAFLGHLYPVWLKFKGGKGVATFIGVLLGLHWPLALIFCGVWLVTAFVTRISSLSALLATLSVPVYYLVYGLYGLGFVGVMSLLIYWKHRDNIGRILAGQESRIGAKST